MFGLKKMHDFKLSVVDTDSIAFSKSNGNPFEELEQAALLAELNSLFPHTIVWEHDGIYPKLLVIKAKNYILWDGVKLKVKGSALKASTKELALKEFINEMIDYLINDRTDYVEVYNRYVREIMDIKDMKRWASRKTLTQAILTNERANEKKVRDALEGSGLVEGDRFYTYFAPEGKVMLLDRFDGMYDKVALLKKLYNTAQIFENLIDIKSTFINYSLKRSELLLTELVGQSANI
jgi:hypothetical protein